MDLFAVFRQKYLYSAIDNSSLIVFRVLFGFLLTAEAWGAIFTGWVKRTLVDPEFTFTFIGFEFLQPLPGDGMYYYFLIMGVFGILVMLGWYYRLSVILYLVMWTAVYLMQKSHYNNHYYLLLLLLGIMAFMPANRFASLDVKRKPALESITCPGWVHSVVIVQMWIVYTYAGFSKIYSDWLLAKPVKLWFAGKQNYWLIGDLLQEEWVQYGVAYGGIFFDLLVVPGLLWKKTRVLTFSLALFFHLFNSAVFQIGIFPYLALALFIFFFDPERVRRLFLRKKPALSDRSLANVSQPGPLRYLVYGYFAIQALLPLRYHLFPGNVHWTEEGHRLSWKMMLRSKSSSIKFRVVNKATGEERSVNPKDYLTGKQYYSMAGKPDMVWQFVQFLKMELAREGWKDVSVFAVSRCSLNGDPYQALILPDYDLAAAEWRPFRHSEWISPYQGETVLSLKAAKPQ